MERKNRNALVAVAAFVVGCCICAVISRVVAVRRYCSVCRTSYLNLSSAALSRP